MADCTMTEYKVTNLAGTPTDYSDPDNWAHLPEHADKDVDTIFIYPTVYANAAPDAPAIVPVDDPLLRAGVQNYYSQGPQVFEDLTNLYVPYYRQSNLAALVRLKPEEVIPFQLREQRTDVYAALDYYFEHYNQGRPFILAGHSQGSIMLKIAFRDYFLEHASDLKRMVAAYVLGFSITTDDLAANPALKFAGRADDTGVIVSWNTEGPESRNEHSCVVLKNAIAINPLNWKRDDSYAPASENLGDRIPVYDRTRLRAVDFQEHHPGLADARLNVERGVVVCSTLPDWYIRPVRPGAKNLFGPASLHLLDYPAYWNNIRENVQTRIKAYFSEKERPSSDRPAADLKKGGGR